MLHLQTATFPTAACPTRIFPAAASSAASGWGAELDGAVLRQITMENSNLRYASFDRAKLQELLLHNCDFTEASFSEVRWKNLSADGCRFLRTNFFKTPLSGMDFTQNELLAPILSSPPSELRGAKISLLQAADLIELFGVKVDR